MSTFVLDTTTKTIKVNMSGAAATTNPDFTAAYGDDNGTTFVEGANDGALSGTSDVTVIAAPAASTRRVVKQITIENKDTAAVTITVKYDNNGTQRTIAKVTLNVGDTWTTDGTFDTYGNLKQTLGTVNLSTGVTGVLPIANGGTNSTATPTAGALAYGTGSAFAFNSAGTSGQALLSGGTGAPTFGTLGIAAGGTGQTTASAAFNALSPITSTGDLILGNGTNSATRLAIGTNGYVLTSNGTTASWAAASGVSLSANNTWTGTQTFSGTSSIFATSLLDANETVNVVAAAPSSTTNFYIQSGAVQYYTSNASTNWTLNIAFSSGTSLNTALATGQSVTFVLVTTQGSTAYYNSAVTIDGTSVTPKWIGGAPTAGNASGLDVYRMSVVKTASATYTVLASLTQYK